jgi:hypothetical protein
MEERSVERTEERPLDRFIRFWWVWAIAALVAGAVTSAASQGFPIVELELAGTVARADEVIRGADLDAIQAAIVWDFLFIALYAPALFFGSLWAARQFHSSRRRSIGTAIGIGGLATGLLDVIENLAMLGYLNQWGGWDGWPTLSAVMAVPKFILALVAIVYILVGIAMAFIRKILGR